MNFVRNPLSTLVAAIPLLLTACAGVTTRPSNPAAAGSPSAAPAMTARILSPASGTAITENSVTLQLAASGFVVNCDLAGKPNKDGFGHYHLELDHALVNMYCDNTVTLSLQNVAPGQHTLTVLPAMNNHMEVKEGAQSITFTYRTSQPLPAITAAGLGTPSVKIMSPHSGDTVSGTFPIQVQISNFNPSCDLFGKPNLAGYGHWHVNVDSMSGPMMGMGTMLGMSCGQSFQVSTAGLTLGHHTFFAILTDNQHAPLMPRVVDQVDVTVQ